MSAHFVFYTDLIYDKKKKVVLYMMEKYGAEVETYEVLKVVPFQPEEKEVIASNLTMDEAMKVADEGKDRVIVPSR